MLHRKLKKFIDSCPADGRNNEMLVVGPPGTGKTYQLVRLVEYLLNTGKVSPEKILVFCFNRRWAKILRERISELAGRSCFEIPVLTFFAFCTELLDKSGAGMDKQVEIITAPAQWKLLRDVIEKLSQKKNYPITSRLIKLGPFVLKSYIQESFDFILRAQENLLSPRDFLGSLSRDAHPQLYELGGIYLAYLDALRERHLYNYGMLLTDAMAILESGAGGNPEKACSRDVVIVDELQELNKAQLKIAQKVSENAKCVYFGNDDECTYAFRGSLLNNFIRIHSSLSESAEERILYLEKNYRNSAQINAMCSDFISVNEYRIDKKSLPGARVNKKMKTDLNVLPVLKESGDVLEETKFICDYIKKLVILKKIRPEKICIIIKGLGYKTDILENALSGDNILFLRRGTRNVLDNKFVKYMLDFANLAGSLKCLLKKNTGIASESNGNGQKDIDFYDRLNALLIRLLSSEINGINPVFVRRAAAADAGLLKIIDIECRSGNGLPGVALKNTAGLMAGYKEDILKTEKFILKLNAFLNLDGINAYNFFARLLYDKQAGIIRHLADDKTIPVFKKEGLLGNAGDFLQSVKIFCKNNPAGNSINDYIVFLENIIESGFIEEIEESTKYSTIPGYINIMSYHQCKGMEFDAVLMPFVNREYLPSSFKDNQLYDMQIFNYMSEGKTLPEGELKKKHYEDERKLFYTGISRGKKFLLITSNTNEGRSAFFEEMSFIYDLRFRKNHAEINKESPPNMQAKILSGKSVLSEKYPGIMDAYLLRKKANVMAYKLYTGKKIDRESFYRTLAYLKLFYPPDNWWRLRKETENNKKFADMHANGFSYTSLSTYSECPARYKYRYYFSMKEAESISARIGTLYHAVIKRFYADNPGDLSWLKLENIIKSEFKPEEFNFPYLYNEVTAKALNDFRNYFEKFASTEKGGIIVEQPFLFDIHDKTIKGRVDKISLPDQEKLVLADFKSGSKNSAYSDLENEIQMPLYALALKKSDAFHNYRNKKPVFKYIFLGGESTDELLFEHKSFDFGAFEEKILKIIERIEKEDFGHGPKSRFVCRNCAFNLICKIRHETGN